MMTTWDVEMLKKGEMTETEGIEYLSENVFCFFSLQTYDKNKDFYDSEIHGEEPYYLFDSIPFNINNNELYYIRKDSFDEDSINNYQESDFKFSFVNGYYKMTLQDDVYNVYFEGDIVKIGDMYDYIEENSSDQKIRGHVVGRYKGAMTPF